MADTVPGNTSTTQTISVGGSRTGTIDTAYDQDWYRVTLLADALYDVSLTGSNDPYLFVYNSAGTLLSSDDDSGAGLNSYIRFTSSSAGTYYLGAGGWYDTTGTFTLSISFVTRIPNATNDSLGSISEDTSVVWNASSLLANDTDPDGDTLSLISVGSATGGSVSLSGGVVTFVPNADYSGSASFQYQISDGKGGIDTATASFTVNPVPDAPDARDDSPAPETVIVFNNDGTPNEQGFLFTNFTENGNLGASNSPMAYVHPANVTGSMARADGSDFGLQSIWLNGYQGSGTALIQGYRDGVLVASVSVTVNDQTAGGAPTQLTFDSSWAAVDLVVFTPPAGSYLFVDNIGIGASNAFDVNDNASIAINVLSNDRDADGDTFAVTGVTDGAHGTTSINADGTVQYTPDGTYAGPDSFTYTITDSTGRTDTATVFVNVIDVNRAPIVANALVDQSVPEDSAVSFTVPSDAFSDVDGDALTLTATLEGGDALPAWLSFNAETGAFSGTPPLDYNGSISVTVTANDGSETASDTFVLAISPVNDAPVVADALPDALSTEDTAWSYTVSSAAFADVDGDTLTYSATLGGGTPLPSWLMFDAATLTFSGTPPLNFNGTIDVTVVASDGSLSASDTFALTITPVNDAPVVANALVDQSVPEDVAANFTVPSDAFSDVDGDALTLTATLEGGDALPAWLSFNAETGTFSGTPPLDYNGSISVTVTANDGSETASDTFVLAISPVNDAPVVPDALPDALSAEDTAWSYTVSSAAFADVDGDTLTYSATLGGGTPLPSWLMFDAATLTFSGTPPLNFNGTIDVTVVASDGSLSASDTFALTITPVNDAPVVANALVDQSVPEDSAVSFTVPTNAFGDVDGDTLTYSATLAGGASLPTWLDFDASTRTFSGLPPANFNGSFNIEVSASDGSLTVSDVFSLTVTPVNDAPLASADSDEAFEAGVGVTGANATGNLLTNDSDVDVGDSRSVTNAAFGAATTSVLPAVLNGAYGTLTLQANGDYSYAVNQVSAAVNALAAGQIVSEQFGYTMVDSGGLTSSASLTISLTGANDGPVVGNNLVAVAEDATTANLWSVLLGNDHDPDAGDSLTIQSVNSSGTLGHVIFDAATQSLRYVADHDSFDALAPGATASDQFTYTVVDSHGATSTATVTVNVTGIADGVVISGSGRSDHLYGTAGEDTLRGGDGNDVIAAGAGHDVLDGGKGIDYLNAGAGNDVLIGGKGNDTLIGGAGSDTFVFGKSGGNDVVYDFNALADQIRLDGISLKGSRSTDANHDGIADLVLDFGSNGSVTLYSISNLSSVHFEGASSSATSPAAHTMGWIETATPLTSTSHGPTAITDTSFTMSHMPHNFELAMMAVQSHH